MDNETKVCNRCLVNKPLAHFSPNKTKPQGVKYSCKPCSAKEAKLRRKEIPLTKEQKEAAKARSSAWRELNPTRAKQIKAISVAKKPYVKRAAAARYRASKNGATPSWLTEEQKQEIQNFYRLKDDVILISGELYHVDHIVPLKGDTVCGLHVPWNLQLLPSDLNCRKSNTYNGW